MRRLLALLPLVLLLAAAPLGGARAAAACVAGSAFAASADRPHIVDPRGDVSGTPVGGADSVDLTAAWVSAILDEAPSTYRLTIAVDDLADVAPSTAFVAEFGPADGDRPWVAAVREASGTWAFVTGDTYADLFFAGAVHNPGTHLNGEVDEAAGHVSIVLPTDIAPPSTEQGQRLLATVDLTARQMAAPPNPDAPITLGVPMATVQVHDSLANAPRCAVDLADDRT